MNIGVGDQGIAQTPPKDYGSRTVIHALHGLESNRSESASVFGGRHAVIVTLFMVHGTKLESQFSDRSFEPSGIS